MSVKSFIPVAVVSLFFLQGCTTVDQLGPPLWSMLWEEQAQIERERWELSQSRPPAEFIAEQVQERNRQVDHFRLYNEKSNGHGKAFKLFPDTEEVKKYQGEKLNISFDFKCDTGWYLGKEVEIAIEGVKGPVLSLVYTNLGTINFNGTELKWRNNRGWNTLSFTLDFEEYRAEVSLNSVVVGEEYFLRPVQPNQLEGLSVTNKLLLRKGTHSVDSYIGGMKILGSMDQVLATEKTSEMIEILSGGEMYRLKPVEYVFSSHDFQWQRIPHEFRRNMAVRTELNSDETLKLRVKSPGRLYAVLWKWDYGFFNHLPEGFEADIHGWKRVSGVGVEIRKADAPFSPLPVYFLDIGEGEHEIEVSEYFGKWVVIGFAPSMEDIAHSEISPQINISSAYTVHNICSPGQIIDIESDGTIVQARLFQHGEISLETSSDQVTAPDLPGRYVLTSLFDNGTTRFLPLTVRYDRAEEPGWEEGFFPIHFYKGWGYIGLFDANPERKREYETLSMFELGANTFFTDPTDELVDALGGRRIILSVAKTRSIIRDEQRPLDDVLEHTAYEGSSFYPESENVLGIYVEDEPPLKYAERVKSVEELLEPQLQERHLLYCMSGGIPDFWETAGSSVRMTRMYPIRKKNRDDRIGFIRTYLADKIVNLQQKDQAIPLWIVLQSFGDNGKMNIWDPPTEEELRLMVSLSLSRGAKGITYFCYDSSPKSKEGLIAVARFPFVPEGDLYEVIGEINHTISEQAHLLSSLTWIESVEMENPQFDVQRLRDENGSEYIWITNFSYENRLTGDFRHEVLPYPLRLDLLPGRSVLVRSEDSVVVEEF